MRCPPRFRTEKAFDPQGLKAFLFVPSGEHHFPIGAVVFLFFSLRENIMSSMSTLSPSQTICALLRASVSGEVKHTDDLRFVTTGGPLVTSPRPEPVCILLTGQQTGRTWRLLSRLRYRLFG